MKETSKGNYNIIEDSLEQSNDESEINNNNMPKFNYVNNYTPFNFNFSKNVRVINKNLKKFFGFIYYENTNKNESIEKNDKNNNKNDNVLKETKNEKNNKNEIITNSSYNSNNNINYPFNPNLDNLINIVKEDDENEFIEEDSSVVDYSIDDFGFGIDFTIRPDSCLKIVVVNIVNTYNNIDPNYKYQVKHIEEEEGEEEESNNKILTNPSEPVKNNGLDNINNDLIVSKDDEIKNEKRKITYIVKDLLGTGVSGQTFKVFCPKTNNYYALKIIKNKEIFARMSLFEIKTLEALNKNDPDDKNHIIRFYDYFSYNKHLCIVMELLQKTLYQLLEMNNLKGISLGSIRYICRQILQAVEYMHSMKIIHTDLKPENILLSVSKDDNNETNKSNLNISNINNQKNNINQNTNSVNNLSITSRMNKRVQIKIADFGTACTLQKLQEHKYIQSMYYRAPEVIIGLLGRTEKIDVWSIGCILGELYLGTPIMPGISSYDQLNKINTLIGECPQYMIEQCSKRDKYFIKDNITDNYRIKQPEDYYKEYPKEPKSEYKIPKNMRSIDDLINTKETIKSKNSLHKSLQYSSFSQNSSITREDTAAFIYLLKGMLQIDPNKRLSCKQCLKHPFLTKENLNKFISLENQLKSNSNSNNSFNFNNNCRSMNMNKSFNKFQTNKGQLVNKNNTFYGEYMNSANRNNFSFGNYNCNNNMNFNYPPYFPSNANQNFYRHNYNYNNNNINNNNNNYNHNNNNNSINCNNNNNAFQGNMNFKNKKMNSSFSFNNNYNMNLYPNANMFNFDPNRRIPQNFFPYPNNGIYYNNQNNFNNIPNYMNYNNNPYMQRHNNTFIGSSFERLNTSYNSNLSRNSKNNKQMNMNNQQYHKNKKNKNPNEFLFNKENKILGNLEDNKPEIKYKENTNTNDQEVQDANMDKNNNANTQSTLTNDDKNKKDNSKDQEDEKYKDEDENKSNQRK